MRLFRQKAFAMVCCAMLAVTMLLECSMPANAREAERTKAKVVCKVYVGFTYKLGVVNDNGVNIMVDSWKCTDPNVITVKRIDNKFASMKAVGKGRAYVYAYKDRKRVGVYDVTVKPSMVFSTESVLIEKGKSKKIKADLVGKGQFYAASSDTSICSVKVTATGNHTAEIRVRGLKPGTTTVKVTNSLSKETAYIKVTVKKTSAQRKIIYSSKY